MEGEIGDIRRIGRIETVTAFAPAGIGNLAAGFDVLGAAIAPLDGRLWGDLVGVRSAGSDSLRCIGPFAHRLPANPKDNLVWRARSAFERQIAQPLPPLAFVLHKNLPVASGLGSSASSAAATPWPSTVLRPTPGRGGALDRRREAESSASGAMHLDNVRPRCSADCGWSIPRTERASCRFPSWSSCSGTGALARDPRRDVLPRDVSVPLAIAHAQNLVL